MTWDGDNVCLVLENASPCDQAYFFLGLETFFLPAAVVSYCTLRQVRACPPCWRVVVGNVGESKDNGWQWQWE